MVTRSPRLPCGSLQEIMLKELGPLELAETHWVIGDPAGEHMKLLPEGLAHWADGIEQQIIPWPRLMNFSLETQPGKFASSKGLDRWARIMANLSGVGYMASGGSRVGATLRHPYVDWAADFDHHSRKYSRHHINLVDEFLRQAVERKMANRLGDSEWMSAAVDKLSQMPASGSRRRSRKTFIEGLLDGHS